jgi:hypothetical protein
MEAVLLFLCIVLEYSILFSTNSDVKEMQV